MQYLEQPHSCVEMLLNDGEGLTLGPDSDALLNFCDMPMPAQAGAQPGPSSLAAVEKGKALAGSDDEVLASLARRAVVLQDPHAECCKSTLGNDWGCTVVGS